VNGFRTFLLRGNVVDLAVAVVIGAAFGAVVASFVAAFLAPLVGLLTGATGDFSTKIFTIAGTQFPYGQFVQSLITFVLVAAALYFLVLKPVQALMDRAKPQTPVAEDVKECPECLSKIPLRAPRCAFCTVEQLDV